MTHRFRKHRKLTILAVASRGGHWVQLLRIRPALDGHRCVYVSVDKEQSIDVSPNRYYTIPDANRTTKVRLVTQFLRLTYIILRERPDIIISTGAAPGYLAIRLGRVVRARTLFLDSIANVETLSLSGHLASRHADLTLTQWRHLQGEDGPRYGGTVL